MPQPFYSREKAPGPTEWEAGWAPEPVWKILEKCNTSKKDEFMFGPTVYGSVADVLFTVMTIRGTSYINSQLK